jgi:hypothetical protein
MEGRLIGCWWGVVIAFVFWSLLASATTFSTRYSGELVLSLRLCVFVGVVCSILDDNLCVITEVIF